MARILVVDDEPEIRKIMTECLTAEGFQVETALDGETGLKKAGSGSFDVILLDVILPVLNGFDVLRRLRAETDVPVIMVTGKGEQVDRIVGLEIGADDYVVKPCDPRELVARIRTILRRIGRSRDSDGTDTRLTIGDVQMDTGARTVIRSGEKIHLTTTEFNLLEALLRRAGRFVTREELTHDVLNRALYACDRAIDTHVCKLRRKLGHNGIERIKSIRNVGYLYSSGPTE